MYSTMSALPVSKPTCPIPSPYGMQHAPPMLPCCAGEMYVVPASIAVIPLMARTFTSSLRSEEHTSELQSRRDFVCRLLLEKKKMIYLTVFFDNDTLGNSNPNHRSQIHD